MKSVRNIFLAMMASIPFSNAQNIDPWRLKYDATSKEDYYGVTVGNGMIGLVSSPEPFKIKNNVMAGVYDKSGRGKVSNFINGFNILDLSLEVNGYGQTSRNLSQELNMHKASFTTSFDYGDKAFVSYTYYALRQLPFAVLMDVTITAKDSITITPASIIRAPSELRDVQNYHNEIYSDRVSISLLTSSAKSPTGKIQLCASTAFLFDDPQNSPRLVHEMIDNDLQLVRFTKTLKQGESFRFSIIGSSITSAHHDDPLNEAERITIFASLQGRDRLLHLHEKCWRELWESDIKIEGDPQAQQDVHNMLYHLYSFTRSGSSLSMSPMGLSGLGYNGHVFWDTEMWMFPALLILHPEIAESLINYRFNQLDAAKANAFVNGFQGAMYPWESADTGVEETPVKYMSGTFEHHITGCVAFATWSYYCVTQNKEWLMTKGWPILSSTAEFWMSRVERSDTGIDIRNVVGADEWAENVDNNSFTNAVAKLNLIYATEAAKILGLSYNKEWKTVADNLTIEKFDDGVTKEYRQYDGRKIKQADANLLSFPLKIVTDPIQIRNDLHFYESRVPEVGTPAMTKSIFSLLYARLGETEKAYNLFGESYLPNVLPPFRVLAETRGGNNPYFATGAGGVLQSILMGFGGLDIVTGGIVQKQTHLPIQWKSLKITGVGPHHKTYEVH